MLLVVLFFLIVIVATGLCSQHYNMRNRLLKSTERDVAIVKRAAEHSINASNTVNPVIALTEVVRATQIVESLHLRHGPELASENTGVNTIELLDALENQKEKIMTDVLKLLPSAATQNPLVNLVTSKYGDDAD